MSESIKLLKNLLQDSEVSIYGYSVDHDCFRSRQAPILTQIIIELEARIVKLEQQAKKPGNGLYSRDCE